jgi:cyclohexanecarboxyl-CoA dehydrogenase
MECGLSEHQRDLVEAARTYSAERLGPHYRQRDREAALDPATLAEMGKLGFLGVEFPEHLGGLGQDCLTAGLVVEALCAEDMNIGYVTINASLVGQILREHGSSGSGGCCEARSCRRSRSPSPAADRTRRR